MAHIFKHPDTSHKGLLVFTHKEWGGFTGNKVIRKLKREGRIPSVLFQELRPCYSHQIKKLKENYFIGIHYGCYYPYPIKSTYIDFIMSRESNVPHLDPAILRLPFNSREFIPASFKHIKLKKIFDIITVAHNVTVKNWPLMFDSIKRCFKVRPETTFLLIVPSQKGVKYGVEKDLAKRYYGMFSKKEQAKIAFLYLHPQLEWGLHQSQLANFYNMSKIFTLFSSKEGESRVISEALCCGLPVVVYSKLLGGGKDLLTENNSVCFKDYEQAHQAWIKALKRFPEGVLDKPETKTREDHTISKLHEHFKKLYTCSNMTYDQNLLNTDHLDRRLPAHYYNVPWMKEKAPTADILSKQQFVTFLNELTI